MNSQLSDALLLPQAITAVIELLINKAIKLNKAPINVAGLTQKTLTVTLIELPFPLTFTVYNSANLVEVIVNTTSHHSDCVIKTSISTLKKLKAHASLTQLIKNDELIVEGDLNIAQQFASFAQSLDIDWQTEVAKHLGDIPTHNLLHFGNKVTNKLITTKKQAEADISEYVVHEQRLVITSSQLKRFNDEVNVAVDQLDGLSQRVAKLIERTSKP